MSRTAPLRWLALAALALPLVGCAFGAGSIGPAGPGDVPPTRFGLVVGMQYEGHRLETLTGMRDTTWRPELFYPVEFVWNIPGNAWGLGLSSGFVSTGMDRFPGQLTYHGWVYGPSIYRKLGSKVNVSAKAMLIGGKLEDPDHHYGALASSEDLPGRRYAADLNFINIGNQGGCLRIGYQWTESDEKSVFGLTRKFHSEGPYAGMQYTWY
ncbi:MAG: hypothetical protein U0704_09060 [Candidatus Eisenbacteria bacterium]